MFLFNYLNSEFAGGVRENRDPALKKMKCYKTEAKKKA